jgi:hypothetical protein
MTILYIYHNLLNNIYERKIEEKEKTQIQHLQIPTKSIKG